MHEVLINRLGGLSLPRKSVVRLTDRPDMTLDVYRVRKTTIQQQQIQKWGWSGGAMVLGKLPVPGRPTILIPVGQGPTALAVGAGGGCLDIFTLSYHFSTLSPSFWEAARYRLKYRLKGPLNPQQPTRYKNHVKGQNNILITTKQSK